MDCFEQASQLQWEEGVFGNYTLTFSVARVSGQVVEYALAVERFRRGSRHGFHASVDGKTLLGQMGSMMEFSSPENARGACVIYVFGRESCLEDSDFEDFVAQAGAATVDFVLSADLKEHPIEEQQIRK
jgi:hypothetical protein